MFPRKTLRTSLVLAALAGALPAHVHLDAPNGGELLSHGQTLVIQWHVVAQHATLGWDLEYSATGSSGPWIPIAMGLPPGDVTTGAVHTHAWTVPALTSATVQVRVRQVNLDGIHYLDQSDDDLAIGTTLAPDQVSVSISSGGTQSLLLDAGPTHAFSAYVVAGSASGVEPGISHQGFSIPLNPDAYFALTLDFPNQLPLPASLGGLDGFGRALVPVVIPGGVLPPSFAGLELHHAAAVLDGTGSLAFVTTAASLTLAP